MKSCCSLEAVSRGNVTDESRLEALRAHIPHIDFHTMSGVLGLWVRSTASQLPAAARRCGRYICRASTGREIGLAKLSVVARPAD
jgi:hypothetical protein